MSTLHGVITSMLTPFTDEFRLDEETMAGELEFQLSRGVHGICVLGGTGESLSLSPEERERVVAVAAEAIQGRVPLVVGCFIPQEEEIIAFAHRIEALGATALMLTPPAFYKVTAYQFQRLLERLSQGCSLPLVVYNAPARAGVKLSAEEVSHLVSSVPSVIGVKDAAGDMADLVRMAADFGSGCALLQGLDDVFLPSLAGGASGGILAAACLFPQTFVEIYDGWRSGAVERARALQLELAPLMAVVGREPMPVLVKEGMKAVGRPTGPTRPPLYEPAPENRRALWTEVEKLLAASRG